ncbi:hypothetical protein WA158_002930 [Blastocystis sp. Blastoise]
MKIDPELYVPTWLQTYGLLGLSLDSSLSMLDIYISLCSSYFYSFPINTPNIETSVKYKNIIDQNKYGNLIIDPSLYMCVYSVILTNYFKNKFYQHTYEECLLFLSSLNSSEVSLPLVFLHQQTLQLYIHLPLSILKHMYFLEDQLIHGNSNVLTQYPFQSIDIYPEDLKRYKEIQFEYYLVLYMGSQSISYIHTHIFIQHKIPILKVPKQIINQLIHKDNKLSLSFIRTLTKYKDFIIVLYSDDLYSQESKDLYAIIQQNVTTKVFMYQHTQ